MPTSDAASAGRIVVAVVRTGGIAGLRREWRADPPPPLVARWRSLVAACPWDEGHRATGADRFEWSVSARCGDDEHRVRLGDAQVTGPWRVLVDAVRDFVADA